MGDFYNVGGIIVGLVIAAISAWYVYYRKKDIGRTILGFVAGYLFAMFFWSGIFSNNKPSAQMGSLFIGLLFLAAIFALAQPKK